MAATSFFRRVVLRIDTQHVDFAKVTESTPLLPLARRAVERYSSSDEKKTLQWAVATDSHATKNAEDEACSPCRTRASDGDYTVAAFIIGAFVRWLRPVITTWTDGRSVMPCQASS